MVQASHGGSKRRSWWTLLGCIHILWVTLDDLQILLQYLDAPNLSPTYIRLVTPLVEWDSMERALLDASYAGIRGWTPHPLSLICPGGHCVAWSSSEAYSGPS